MSHISKIEIEVKDLATLKKACKKLGLRFVENKQSYKWYGNEETCDHGITVPGANYEIGVIKNKDRFDLNCDFYDRNIEKHIGNQGGLLKQAYAVVKTKSEARRKGYSVLEKRTDNGIKLHIRVA